MELHSLVSTYANVLHEHAGMGYFVDLLLKSLFVLVLMLLANLCSRRLPASLRHLALSVGFISLFILPLFIGFLPKIQVPIAADTAVSQSTVTLGIVSLADELNLAMGAWWQAFLDIYFALVGLQVLYILLGLHKVFSLSRAAGPVENPLIRQELDNLVLEEGLTVSVALRKSRDVWSPVSWGLFSPEILLPVQAETWRVEKIRNVLIHELSHIQRLDWLTSLIVRLTRAIYWFNPLVWYAARRLEEEAEQACDDAVIRNGRCHNEYASNLLEIASQARLGSLGNAVVQAIAGSPLGSRVFSILDTSRKRHPTEVAWVVRGILMGCTVIAVLASLRLVPLVNVTSIDPHASTAFSVIFIPGSEAATIDGYVDKQAGGSAPASQREPGGKTAVRVTSPAGKANEAGQSATVMASAGADNGGVQGQASLLEEYMDVTGSRDGGTKFGMNMQQYARDIARQAESGIDLAGFAEEIAGDKATLVAIHTISPEYPWRARSRGIEGYSVVEYEIDSQGEVRDAVIVDSSPGSVFDRSALRAIEQYRFKPPRRNGETVSVVLQTKFVFQLKSG